MSRTAVSRAVATSATVGCTAASRIASGRLTAHAALAVLAVLAVLVGLVGCRREAPVPAVAVAAPPSPPVVGREAGAFTLRYFSPVSGDLIPVKTVAQVPDGARAQVLVVPDDPKLQGTWLFVADVSAAEATEFPVQVVDRYEIEQAWQDAQAVAPTQQAPAPGGPAAAQNEVILYKTTWCGYCRKAAEYLRLKGVTFVARDIERESGARADMLARAASVGVPPERLTGVPILWVRGRLLTGFDRAGIDAALAAR